MSKASAPTDVFSKVILELQKLEEGDRARIMKAMLAFFGMEQLASHRGWSVLTRRKTCRWGGPFFDIIISPPRNKAAAPSRSALEKFAAVQMVDVRVPTTDGRELLLTRHTQPQPELKLLLERLRLELPAQPPPKISAALTIAV